MSAAPSLPDLTGSTYVVTGANSGIGLEAAKKLAGAGGKVVLAVRDVEKGEAAAAQIPGETAVRRLDLADLASVHAFADAWDEPITTLVNNAGIMMVAEGRTVDGFERQIGTNHLGHFALTNLLLPHVTDRVVSVSSGLHNGPQVDLDNLDLEGAYKPTRAYQQSKLANLLFTAELQRRLAEAGSTLTAHAAHPGYSATNLQTHHANPLMNKLMWVGNKVIATSAEFGARPTVHAVVADLPPNSYIGPTGFQGLRGAPGPNPRSKQARDADVARRLWDLSEQRTAVSWGL
ncbi:oxidoreductase [Nocardioides sp.]|jgi:NAD(P)-dependent dehydrogenase (short-subunit alcohol dehydrogenase family)|uniref:oxidoreductase n=1 Tax=Nocardioides sp. TaxID=35761 RepID=UPI001D1B6DB5|nr:oxidoreductase [Nocardioides sp.]MBU1803073.1 SDR family NAD(P)-dependent oxidoreductase [Actinomycetota bacterium]